MPKKLAANADNENNNQNARSEGTQSLDPEQQLLLRIEKLSRQQTNTLQLYVQVARLLFFEEEIIPTTNRMYQLVRRGSMGTPAQALRMLWSQLRDESQVRVKQAALPATVVRQAEQVLVLHGCEAAT